MKVHASWHGADASPRQSRQRQTKDFAPPRTTITSDALITANTSSPALKGEIVDRLVVDRRR
jgi:hypothetical protein